MEKNNPKVLTEICKEVVSEMVENGFYEKNLSVEQFEKLKKIKKQHELADDVE